MWRRKSKTPDESYRALVEAQAGLKEAKERGPEVTKVSGSLKLLRDENHFSKQLENLFDRKGHTP